MKNSLLLMDFNNILYRAMELTNLSLTWKGMSTNGIFGFINQFCNCVNAIKPKYVIVCNDRKPYDRTKLFPEYKADRAIVKDEKRIKEVQFNIDKTRELLDLLNIEYWSEKGLEADDLISLTVKKYHNDFRRIVIYSGDSDLNQLLKHHNVCLRRKVKGKYILYSIVNFKEEYENISIKQYIKYLAIVGTHNSIPGISGLGPVKALKIVKDEELLNACYQEHGDKLRLYERLIKLPFRTNTVRTPELKEASCNRFKFIRFLSGLGIRPTAPMETTMRILEGG